MGVYVYKVTKQIKVLKDGTRANVAVFAYKPTWGWGSDADKLNARWAKESGCPQAERFARQQSKSWMGRAVLGETGEVAIPVTVGTFDDSWFDMQVSKMRNNEMVAVD